MRREEIEKILPHRDGMLLVDEAELVDGVAHGKKIVRPEEWFLQGHFPGNPVVPGVILCEILAQSACVLLAPTDGKRTPFLTGLEKVRFKGMVRPGDTLETECRILRSKGGFYWAQGEGRVKGSLCVSAEFSFYLSVN
jgi:3-hydroxyacyl-[acyl-carrier-protein] dehydratase